MGAAHLHIQSLGLLQHRSLRPLSAPVASQRPTGDEGNGEDGTLPLGCEGCTDHLAHPATAGGEDGFPMAPSRLLVITTLPCYWETRLVTLVAA